MAEEIDFSSNQSEVGLHLEIGSKKKKYPQPHLALAAATIVHQLQDRSTFQILL